jgi:hypothetical protein
MLRTGRSTGWAKVIFHRQRREERTRIAVEARLIVGEYDCPAMLLNASTGGVLAALPQPPVRGTRIKVKVGDVVLVGQVRWRGVDCCGIALRDPINISQLMEGDTARVAMIPQPRALRGIGGMLRVLVGERTSLRAAS